jgi:hypothetical protein
MMVASRFCRAAMVCVSVIFNAPFNAVEASVMLRRKLRKVNCRYERRWRDCHTRPLTLAFG